MIARNRVKSRSLRRQRHFVGATAAKLGEFVDDLGYFFHFLFGIMGIVWRLLRDRLSLAQSSFIVGGIVIIFDNRRLLAVQITIHLCLQVIAVVQIDRRHVCWLLHIDFFVHTKIKTNEVMRSGS